MNIAFIGGGAMGEAMLAAILDRRLATPEALTVSDIDESRRQHLNNKYRVSVVSSNVEAVSLSDVVVLAVKPQNLAGVMSEINGQLKNGQLVLSIIAGAKLNSLTAGLNHKAIVRVMPNTPARIGEGMSVWTATAEVTAAQRETAASILGAMGKQIYVGNEDDIDKATAVSGSGPAYIFLMIESLTEAAVHIGLAPDVAQQLVLQTVLGAARYVVQSGVAPAELRWQVTSPGGTTAAALQKFEAGGFSDLVKQAVAAAYHRARELGGS